MESVIPTPELQQMEQAGRPESGAEARGLCDSDVDSPLQQVDSPFPSPSVMAGYKKVSEDLPGRVMDDIKAESEWRRAHADKEARRDHVLQWIASTKPLIAFGMFLAAVVLLWVLGPDKDPWLILLIAVPFTILFGASFIVNAKHSVGAQESSLRVTKR